MSHIQLPENELVNLAKKGDDAAFDKLMIQSIPTIKHWILKSYKISPSNLDDIIQIASIKAWNKIKDFQAKSSFATWFFCIAKNSLSNYCYQRTKIEKFEIGLLGDDGLEFDEVDEKLNENALSIIEKRESIKEYQKMIEDVFSRLSAPQKKILKMTLEDNMSYKEVADILKVPIGTVMSRLYFARKNAKILIIDYARKNSIQLDCVGKHPEFAIS